MIITKSIEEIKEGAGKGLVATAGFFDGVHAGHRFLLDELASTARLWGLPSAVITFAEHPREVLQTGFRPKLLNSFEEKMERLAALDIDYGIVMHFTPSLAQLSAAEFITDVLAGEWKVKTLLTGYDHRFGRGREDGFPEYRAYGAACGMDVLEAGRYGLGEMKVSSSEIRRLLAKGQVEGAAQMLGYPYCLKGHIVPGHKIGRTLGFPTANIRIGESFKMLPATGVYAVEAVLHGGRYHGMLYIGSRPTLNNGEAIPEVHIFGFTGEAYGSEITVSFLRYVRGDIRFASLDELKRQLERDKQSIISMLEDGK